MSQTMGWKAMKKLSFITGVLLLLSIFVVNIAADQKESNLIPNGDFTGKAPNGLPAGWIAGSPRPALAPAMRLVDDGAGQSLMITGAGNPDCVGWVSTQIRIERGKTYWFRVRFRKSDDLNPMHHLSFQVTSGGTTQVIGEFHRLDDIRVEGEGRISFPGQGQPPADVRIIFCLCAEGRAWIEHISLTETTPAPPRWVRVACTDGPGTLEEYGLEAFTRALDTMGEHKVDLALLPEYFSGEGTTETLSGASALLMSEKAGKYRMYVAGTIGRYDPKTDRLYNSALLFDRGGKMIGCYDKVHLYGPELLESGVTPGDSVPVFETDFGKVGFMTCSDSWFTDVAELAALKGADILLFPNLGYDRGLMHARSLDNRINIVTSTRSGKCGVWDIFGRDICGIDTVPENNEFFKDVVRIKVANMGVLMVTLDLNAPRHREISGGTIMPVLRGKKHFGNQKIRLEEEIGREKTRWQAE